MMDTIWVSLAVTAGIIALAGVPLRCWQFYTGQLRSQVPPHALARATFSVFATLILVPNSLAWAYSLHVAYYDYAGAQSGAASAIAVGMLGCAYLLLEGFLLTSRWQPAPRPRHPGNALVNSAAKRE
jgi:hypothetical protein